MIKELLPNRRSKDATPASLRIDLHYARLNVHRRWDWHRYERLAQFLRLTPAELASVVCMPHKDLGRARANNRFHGSAALLLTLLEAQVLREYSHDIIENPIPSWSTQPLSNTSA